MNEHVLLGRGNRLVRSSVEVWRGHVEAAPQRIAERLRFMSPEHHAVRDFVVRELPRCGALAPEHVGHELNLPASVVESILDELESGLFFLVRGETGAVRWAFPVTVDPTPHRVRLSTGERLFAA